MIELRSDGRPHRNALMVRPMLGRVVPPLLLILLASGLLVPTRSYSRQPRRRLCADDFAGLKAALGGAGGDYPEANDYAAYLKFLTNCDDLKNSPLSCALAHWTGIHDFSRLS
jgi:hypothetical protein